MSSRESQKLPFRKKENGISFPIILISSETIFLLRWIDVVLYSFIDNLDVPNSYVQQLYYSRLN